MCGISSDEGWRLMQMAGTVHGEPEAFASSLVVALASIAMATGCSACIFQPVAQSPVQETDRDPEMQIRGCRAAVVSDLGVLAGGMGL